MLIVVVHIHVKPDCIEAFKAATIDNASHSLKEPGIARFDFIQQADEPSRFLLIEAYRDAEAPAAHKKTDHYDRWREAVESMMAQPRFSVKYENVHPDEAGW